MSDEFGDYVERGFYGLVSIIILPILFLLAALGWVITKSCRWGKG